MNEATLWTAASGEEPAAVPLAENAEQKGLTNKLESRPIVYRDSADIRTIYQLLSTLLILLGLLTVSLIGNVWQYWRRPDRIVVDRSNGRVLMINDREFGETDGVKITPDSLGEADKQYLVGEFVKMLYRVNPAMRAADIKSALEMMAPQSAAKFAVYLKERSILRRQRAESWQSVWAPQDIAIDRQHPFTVRVIGRQQLTKLLNNAVVQETKQLQLTINIVADPAGRSDSNRRTGFLIAAIDYKELNL
jgi:hypothetical protein